MSNDTSSNLSSWLREYGTTDIVCVGVRDEDGWVDRNKLTEFVDSFDVELASEPTERYTLSVEATGNTLRLRHRIRIVFRVLGINEDKQLQRNNVEIVVELPGADSDDVPEFSGETETLPAAFLDYVDLEDKEYENFSPVAANRVAGLETEKRRLARFLETGNQQWGLTEPTGLILEGPPGTGKTELVMEICQEQYGELPVTISGPEVLSKWVGESERHLREKFEETLDTSHRILYVDEIDAIARTRTEASQDYVAQLVSQLLVLLDGVDAKGTRSGERPLRVVASTNIAQVIDPALRRPGRLGNRPIQVGRPSEKERVAILHHYLENVHASEDGQLGETLRRGVTTPDGIDSLRRLAAEMEGFTGADIEDIVQEAVGRTRTRGNDALTIDFLKTVLETEFDRPNKYRTKEFMTDDLASINAPSKPFDQAVVELDTGNAVDERAEQVAKRHFSGLARDAPRDQRYVFRTVAPEDILADTTEQTRERTASVFQHINSERLCVYFDEIETLAQVQKHTPLAETAIEVVNEQLIQWHEDNVLLIEESDETDSLLYCFE